MEKAYTRTNWVEDSVPFIDAENLNNIESGIDALDDRTIEMDSRVTEAYNNSESALNGISVIQGTYAKKTELPEIATTKNVGLVKPDGTTTYIDADGTLHAVGGGGGGGTGGTSDYNALSNKPSINGVALQGAKTLEDLGIEPIGSGKTAYDDAVEYTDTKISSIIQSGNTQFVNGKASVTFAKKFNNVPVVVAVPIGSSESNVTAIKANNITVNGCDFVGTYTGSSGNISLTGTSFNWIAVGI